MVIVLSRLAVEAIVSNDKIQKLDVRATGIIVFLKEFIS